MDKILKDYLNKCYSMTKKDLFSVFIYRNLKLCTEYGYVGLMTPFVWMFIKTYEKFRKYIIKNKTISSLIQLEYSAFEEATVPICTFILQNTVSHEKGVYIKLSDFKGGMEVQKEKTLKAIHENVSYKYCITNTLFEQIPMAQIAYWADDVINLFKKCDSISKNVDIKVGLQTGSNPKFLRLWYEVDYDTVCFNCSSCEETNNINSKWYPYNKGGTFRKWYGNQEYVVNWYKDGCEIRNFKNNKGKIKSRAQNTNFYFKPSISWSKISSGKIAFRYYPQGFIFDVAGCSIFSGEDKSYILGFLNSNIIQHILEMISPTLNYEVGNISSIPYKKEDISFIQEIVKKNISLCRDDWDEYETSWNFKKHPLINNNYTTINESYEKYENKKETDFKTLKNNEIELNTIFSKIYELNIDNNVEDKYVSIRKINKKDTVKSFLSYIIGCIFGRYNPFEEGLVYAGGKFNLDNYSNFIPDDDNIVPVLDTEYFEDDIVNRIIEFIKIVYGEETLEENIAFIANELDIKGNSNREKIRKYLLKNFYDDHVKTYKKHPIYWQFDSGKENAFKCLIYMHRYTPDTLTRIRTDYLHKTRKAIEEQIKTYDKIMENTKNKTEIRTVKKDKTKLIKQIDEIKLYDLALAHIANQKIEINLDDGVKINYEKFQNIEVTDPRTNKKKKINLLKKI